jgi:hypothetical protein
MKPLAFVIVFIAGALAGCMAAGPPIGAQSSDPAAPRGQAGSPFSDRAMGVYGIGTPLIIDRTDLRIGTTVQFSRLPTASEVHDATQLPGLARIVVTLPYWPVDLEPLQALDLTPPEAHVVVVLPGYPPNRAAAEMWNYVNASLRIVVVVTDAPPSLAVIGDLNTMRGLERVIAQMDAPSRSGFERLQRPLSFRKIVE